MSENRSEMAPINKEQLDELKTFIDFCKVNPEVLHMPELQFFKDYLESLGGKLPNVPNTPKEEKPKEENKVEEEEMPSEPPNVEEEEVAAEEREEESDIELDKTGVIEPDDDEPAAMGDEDMEVTEEMMEQSDDKRSQAMEAVSNGDLDGAIKLYTEAILMNPQSAALYAKRAGLFIKLNKPNAGIRDCNKALSLNPDQSLAYKFKGRAHRLLGQWEEAAKDLSMACKLDYTDEANDWLKEVTPNAKKIQEHRRKYQRKQEEKTLKENQEKLRNAQEAREKAAKEAKESPQSGDFGGFPGGMPFMPGGGGGIQDILQDPEIVQAFQDPEVAAAFSDITRNPANMAKYQSNPKVQRIINKVAEKMGGAMPGAS